MRKVRYSLRLITAFIARFNGIILISTLIGVSFFFLFKYITPFFLGNTEEVIGIAGRYHAEDLPLSILELVGDGLTKISENGSVEPALSYSWETNDKGKTWTFYLDSDLSWQNGKTLTSSDVTYNFSDVEIERPDENSIVFKLKEPFSPFPSVVSIPTFISGLIGTGKWKVEKISVIGEFIQKIVLTNNNDVLENNTKLKKKKIFKFYPTEDQTKLAFKLGEVDIIENTLNPSPIDKWSTAIVEGKINHSQIVTIFFNNQDKVLSDKKIRQALAYALDKTSFDGERAIGPISSKSWAFNPQVKKYSYNPKRAKELIDALPNETKNNLNINLVSTPPLLSVAEKIAEQWSKMGIKTTVQVSSVIPADFQAYLTIFQTPTDPDQYSIWHSTQEGTNISRYSDPRIDKLLEDGRIELNSEKRYDIYLDFQRFLLEDLPAIFLYHPNIYKITRK